MSFNINIVAKWRERNFYARVPKNLYNEYYKEYMRPYRTPLSMNILHKSIY